MLLSSQVGTDTVRCPHPLHPRGNASSLLLRCLSLYWHESCRSTSPSVSSLLALGHHRTASVTTDLSQVLPSRRKMGVTTTLQRWECEIRARFPSSFAPPRMTETSEHRGLLRASAVKFPKSDQGECSVLTPVLSFFLLILLMRFSIESSAFDAS